MQVHAGDFALASADEIAVALGISNSVAILLSLALATCPDAELGLRLS
jgi:hypothetical protein